MAFHKDPGVREEAPKAAGPRFFFRIIAQEAAALLKLNLLFLLFCLPAVTIPPALLALFQVVRRMPAERTVRCWSQFWDAFHHRWRTAWGAFLLTVLPLTAAGYGAWFYLHFARNNPVSYLPFAFCAVVFLTALLASSYLWGLLSEGRELTKETLLLSLRLGLGRPLRAALAAAGWYLPLAAAVLWLPLSGAYLLLIGFSLPCLLALFLIRTVLERFGGSPADQ